MLPVVELLLLVCRDEFDAKAVVKCPPNMIEEPLALGSIDLTGPLNPPNGTSDHADDDELHNARFSPVP